MAFIQACLAALAALPKLIEFVVSFVKWAEKAIGPNWPEVIAKLEDTSNKLKDAKTPEQRMDAARELQKILGKL